MLYYTIERKETIVFDSPSDSSSPIGRLFTNSLLARRKKGEYKKMAEEAVKVELELFL